MPEELSYARLIVNPAAGAGRTAKRWPQIKQFLNKIGVKFEHDLTEAPGHAVELAKTAVGKGYKLIVSVGGDGTINEVVNGIYDTGYLKDITLGIIGTGTGGDYIRTLGLPRNYQQSCERLLHPDKMIVDLGMVEYSIDGQKKRRLFTNFAGLGFDAEVVKATTKKYKSLGSVPSYLMGLLTTLVCYHNREISLKIDGKEEQQKVCAIIMSNGKYGGGSMYIAPQADIKDGLFDIVIIGDVSKPDLIASLPRIYRGTHLTHPKVTLKHAKEIEIQSKVSIALQADGELLGEAPARFSILPSALTILV
ncbi:MAG TPA: diacylglycerol kinase family protein [Dehalococcoidales bacterium]